MRIEFCGNCAFFADNECRRFPPTGHAVLIDNQEWRYDYLFVYPSVTTDTPCCGEFKSEAREPLTATRAV